MLASLPQEAGNGPLYLAAVISRQGRVGGTEIKDKSLGNDNKPTKTGSESLGAHYLCDLEFFTSLRFSFFR